VTGEEGRGGPTCLSVYWLLCRCLSLTGQYNGAIL